MAIQAEQSGVTAHATMGQHLVFFFFVHGATRRHLEVDIRAAIALKEDSI
jgi:hypothetical protein